MELIYTFLAFLHLHPVPSALYLAFLVWMLIDAARRGAEPFWYLVMLIVQPIGAIVYFFAVKAADFRGAGAWLGGLFQRRASLEELRYKARNMPTLINHLNLASRLMQQGEHDEARGHLEAALKMESDHCPALYNLAVCHKEQGRPAEAVPLLERLLAKDRRWANYLGMKGLVECREQAGDAAGALAACRELARVSPTMENQCLLAEHLLDCNLPAEAVELLERVLNDHQFAPPATRRRDNRWVGEARRLLKHAAQYHSKSES